MNPNLRFTMSTMVFDTLSYADALEESGFTPQQAKGQAHAMKVLIEDQIASKSDLASTEGTLKLALSASEGALKLAIAESKNETIKWVVGIVLSAAAVQLSVITGLLLHLAK